nr:hypothetical protein CFP56_10229 [Quercus suber]
MSTTPPSTFVVRMHNEPPSTRKQPSDRGASALWALHWYSRTLVTKASGRDTRSTIKTQIPAAAPTELLPLLRAAELMAACDGVGPGIGFVSDTSKLEAAVEHAAILESILSPFNLFLNMSSSHFLAVDDICASDGNSCNVCFRLLTSSTFRYRCPAPARGCNMARRVPQVLHYLMRKASMMAGDTPQSLTLPPDVFAQCMIATFFSSDIAPQ